MTRRATLATAGAITLVLLAAAAAIATNLGVLRVATDIDRQYPGQTAGESLAESLDSTFSFVGLENIYRVGSPVVKEIVGNWERWQDGPPPLPN